MTRSALPGSDSKMTIRARCNLAEVYRRTGRPADAVPVAGQALADSQRVRGDLDRLTLLARNNLGSAYRDAGRLADAIPLFERNVADAARVLSSGDWLLARILAKIPPLYGADAADPATEPASQHDPAVQD
jgi:hypothetical protein